MSDKPRREVDDRLADWVDGRLSERERERMVAEMRVNPQLRADLEQYERTVGVLRAALRAPTAPSGSAMADRVLAAIAGERAAPAVMQSRWSKRHAWWSLASAAALLAGALWVDSWSVTPSTLTTTKLDEAAGLAAADDDAKPDGVPPEGRMVGDLAVVDSEAPLREKMWSEKQAREHKVAEERKDLEGKAAGEEPPVAQGKEKFAKEPVAKEPVAKEKGQAEGAERERSEAAASDPSAVPSPVAVQAPAAPSTPAAPPAGNPQPVRPSADGTASSVVGPADIVPEAKDAGRPGAPTRGQPGGAGGGAGNPAGPTTGGPAGAKARAAPAGKPPADPGAADDFYLGSKTREASPAPKKAEGAVEEVGRTGAPAAPGAADKLAPAATLALVEIEGFAEADKAAPSAGRGMPRNRAETKDARELEALRGFAKAPLEAPALQASVDQFLAAAAAPATEAAAVRWITANGVLQVSPCTVAETPAPRLEQADRRVADSERDAPARAAGAATQRTWLVEGDRKDVKLLLERVRVFVDERKWTLRRDETAAPAEVRRGEKAGEDAKVDAEKRVGDAPAADQQRAEKPPADKPPAEPAPAEQRAAELLASSKPGVGADPMRIVLRIRLRSR